MASGLFDASVPFGAALVLAVLGVAVALPGVITDADPLAGDPALALAPPGPEHPFGTDHLGRDVLARVVHGARHSLSIGLFATSAAVAAGVLLGLAAREFAGKLDTIEHLNVTPDLLAAALGEFRRAVPLPAATR